MLDGVVLKDLTVHLDERGYLFEVIHEYEVSKIAYCYMTVCFPRAVHAWHFHVAHADHVCCVAGIAKYQLVDLRSWSPTKGQSQVVVLSGATPQLLMFPPGILHGFASLADSIAMVLSTPPTLYDPKDVVRLPAGEHHEAYLLAESGSGDVVSVRVKLPDWEQKVF